MVNVYQIMIKLKVTSIINKYFLEQLNKLNLLEFSFPYFIIKYGKDYDINSEFLVTNQEILLKPFL
jgi:hypothetical protein